MCMEPQNTPNSQNNLKKEEQRWLYKTSWFQTILQSYSKQESLVFTKPTNKQKNQKTDVDEWYGIKSPEINLHRYGQFWQRSQEYIMGKGQYLQ